MKSAPKAVDINSFKDLPVSHVLSYEDSKLLAIRTFGDFETNCVLKYAQDTICFNLTSSTFKWILTDIKVKFKELEIGKRNLVINEPTKRFDIDDQATITINIKNTFLDLFATTDDRTFVVVVNFKKGAKHQCTSTFKFSLPIIPKQNQWPLKLKLTSVVPDKTVRKICRQNFNMTEFNAPREIQMCILLEEFKRTAASARLRQFGYNSMLKLFLIIEDSFIMDMVESSNLNNHFIQQISTMKYKIKTANKVSEKAESVCLTPMDKIGAHDCQKYQLNCRIIRYANDHVIIEMKRSKQNTISPSYPYHIRFCPSFYSNKISHLALETIKGNGLDKWMLEFDGVKPYVHVKVHQEFNWFNKNISTNPEQKLAVKNVVNQTSKAMPFVIFGPPGTGKTSTLVEAVAQIVTLNPKARILISVNSNSASDEIGERLINFISKNKVYRFYAPSFERKVEKVHPKLKEISNIRAGYNNFPTFQEFYSYNVIISTLVNCGRILAAEVDPKHFDYLFIDECASMAECYAAIPIAVCAQKNKITTQLVFCGDHKQLGPIFNTHHNERFGFSTSLMERVLLLDQYKRNPGYNSDVAIKLVKNFRSHRAILEFSSKQFYNGELQACQSPDIANFAIGWDLLPNKEFPIIFHSVFAASEKEGTSTFNMMELYKTKYYVDHLLDHGINGRKVSKNDIGIVCPYNAQRTRLQQIFGDEIEIGTVEYYQGREKKIIIFSAVRSQTPTIGFLRNEKRLNVALTRAKSLLIVLANPETLYRNHYWRQFIRYCRDNKAIVGWVPEKNLGRTIEELDAEGFSVEDNHHVTLEEMMNGMALAE